jgi:hypothetical protein
MNRRWPLLLLALLVGSPALAGVVFEVEATDHASSPATVEKVVVVAEGKNLKMEIPGAEGGVGEMIFRGERGEMLMIDHDSRTYFVIDREAVQKMSSMMDEVARQMEEALKDVPADQRAMVEQMMKQRMPATATESERPAAELKRTGDAETVNGYPSVRYDLLREGRKASELWVTDWSNIEGGSEVVEVFQEMSSFLHEMLESFASAAEKMGGAGPQMDENPFEYLEELGGFPVLTKEFEDGRLEGEAALLSSKRETIEASAFEPPAGYERQDMKQAR